MDAKIIADPTQLEIRKIMRINSTMNISTTEVKSKIRTDSYDQFKTKLIDIVLV
jgi:hypothetical protein